MLIAHETSHVVTAKVCLLVLRASQASVMELKPVAVFIYP